MANVLERHAPFVALGIVVRLHPVQRSGDGGVRGGLGGIRPHPGRTNTLPLHIEVLYNEYEFQAAFAAASLLALLAIVTLVAKSIVEWRTQQEERG